MGNYLEIKALKDKNNEDLSNLLRSIQNRLKSKPSQEVVAFARDVIEDLKMLKQKYETGTYRKAPKAQIYTKREDLVKHIEDVTEDFDNLSDEFELYSDIKDMKEYPKQESVLLEFFIADPVHTNTITLPDSYKDKIL